MIIISRIIFMSLTKEENQLIGRTRWTDESLRSLSLARILRYAAHPILSELLYEMYRRRPMLLKEPYTWYDYQLDVIAWMAKREALPLHHTSGIAGGMIRLEMGLGKSLISLTHILSLPKGDFPTLIVAPKAVMAEWKTDVIEKFLPDNRYRVLFFHKDYISPAEFDGMTREFIHSMDIVITTYDTCVTACRKGSYIKECEVLLDNGRVGEVQCRRLDQADLPTRTGGEVLYGTPWHRIICDESHQISNPSTVTFKSIMALAGRFKWCLTGTPIRNYNTDLFAQLRFMGYNRIATGRQWAKRGEGLFFSHSLNESIYSLNYSQVNIQMPPLHHHVVSMTFESNGEQKVYNLIHTRAKEALKAFVTGGGSFDCVLVWFLRLRQAAIASYLLCDESKRDDAHAKIDVLPVGHDLWTFIHTKEGPSGITSTKIQQVIKLLDETIPSDAKVLIFSMFVSCLDLLQESLMVHRPDISLSMIDGSVVGDERARIRSDFKTKSDPRVLLMTFKVGSQGLNLTEATHVIFLEPWWTPSVHAQAWTRAWRIGQTKPVHVYHLFMKGSVESKIYDICAKKRTMSQNLLGKEEDVSVDEVYGLGAGLSADTITTLLE